MDVNESLHQLAASFHAALLLPEPDDSPATIAAVDQAEAQEREYQQKLVATAGEIFGHDALTTGYTRGKEPFLRLVAVTMAAAQMANVAACPHVGELLNEHVVPSEFPTALGFGYGAWHCPECVPSLEEMEARHHATACDVCRQVPSDNTFVTRVWTCALITACGELCIACHNTISEWTGEGKAKS